MKNEEGLIQCSHAVADVSTAYHEQRLPLVLAQRLGREPGHESPDARTDAPAVRGNLLETSEHEPELASGRRRHEPVAEPEVHIL